MNANKSFTFPTSLFLHTVLRPRNNGQLPEMDMRTGHPFSSLKFGFRSGGFLSAEEFPSKPFLCQGCGKIGTSGKELDHSRQVNRDYLHLLDFQARHVTTNPLFLDETRFKVFLLLLAPNLSYRIIIAWDQALQWGKNAKNGVKQEKYRRAKQAQRCSWWGGKANLSPHQTTSQDRFALADRLFRPRQFFFSFSP